MILLSVVLLISCKSPDSSKKLFNGKDLTGWTMKGNPKDVKQNYWTVKDGAITLDTKGNKKHGPVWLQYNQEFSDFELSLEVKANPKFKGNSGIQVRSRWSDKENRMNGPQIDLHPPAAWRTGMIYDETKTARRWICPSMKNWKISKDKAAKGWKWNDAGWNTIKIVCKGLTIKTWVNGVVISDFNGDGVLNDKGHKERNVGLKGFIYLQLHAGGEIFLQFKNIKVKELK